MWCMRLIMQYLSACSITIKQQIISEITNAATKTIDITVKQSLKKAPRQEFLEKMKDERVKRLTSLSIPEFKAKGNKIRFEANNVIPEKINQAISFIENGNMKKCQEILQDGKK